jgi:nucleoside-diphosphate-sugar epimerase
VARRLLTEGWRLRCLVHTASHAARLPRHHRLELVSGDVRRAEDWIGKLVGATALIHMAHIGYASCVVNACRTGRVERLIALSSTRRFTRFPDETAQLVLQGEAALEASDRNYTILRSSMIFGGDRDNNVEKLVRWLERRRWTPLVGGGRNRVQPIFVLDLVEAIVRTLERPEATRRRTLTVAGPEPMTQRELIETVGEAMFRPPIWIPVPHWMVYAAAAILERLPRPLVTRAQVRRQREDKVFDITEACAALGDWKPRPFDEAIRLKLAGQV